MNDNQTERCPGAPHAIGGNPSRDAAVGRYAILDTPPERAFDDVAALASDICRAPIAAVSLLSGERQWIKASVGFAGGSQPIEQSFCAHAVARGGDAVFEVPDAALDERFRANPLVTDDPRIRFYAGAPLITPQGVGIGALCVIDTKPRPKGLDIVQKRALKTLASQVVAQLELRGALVQRDQHVADQIATAKELRWLAQHDPLTGLANRTLFNASLETALTERRPEQAVALLMLDLDHFKQFNDRLGHAAGDALLREFARRLRSTVRPGDTVARLGGDEFAVLLPELNCEDDMQRIISAIDTHLNGAIEHEGRLLDCSTTIGVAVLPDHSSSASELIRNADIALYAAKSAGRCRVTMFGLEMLAANRSRMAMIDRARDALRNGWVQPFYQPKIDLRTGRVAGFEALLRVLEPGQPIGLPSTILAAFEDSDLAVRLGAEMISRVVADMARWIDAGIDFGRIAINASAAEFRDDGYAERLLDILGAAGVPPCKLELEVTETVFLDRQSATVKRALHRLVDAGVRIALDDFGTGYASLSHLQAFPVDVLKIDRSFVRDIAGPAGQVAIVNAVIALARDLGIETVAEGIESVAQADYLVGHGCALGQGFLFDAALPAAEVADCVAKGAARGGHNIAVIHAAKAAAGLRGC